MPGHDSTCWWSMTDGDDGDDYECNEDDAIIMKTKKTMVTTQTFMMVIKL